MTDTKGDEVAKARPRRFSILGFSLATALGLAIASALALSYELILQTSDDVVASATGEKKDATAENLKFSFLDRPATLPEIHFVDGAGRPHALSDFQGRPILLNIWATWCVPCRKEMPSLDRLQAKFNPSEFQVVALSIDRQGVPAVTQFYQELGIKSLGIYVDQPGAALYLVRAPGLPTTLFINRDGLEIGRKIGPAEWDSPEAVALLREHLTLPSIEQATGEPK